MTRRPKLFKVYIKTRREVEFVYDRVRYLRRKLWPALVLAVLLVTLCATGCALRPVYRDEPAHLTVEALHNWRLAGIEIARQIGRGEYEDARLGANMLAREIGAAAENYGADAASGNAPKAGAPKRADPPPSTPPIDRTAPTLGRAADALAELAGSKE